MTMNVFCSQPPSLSFDKSGASVSFTGRIEMLVNTSDNLAAFTIDGWAGMSVDIKLKGTTLYGDFNYIDGNFTVSRKINLCLKLFRNYNWRFQCRYPDGPLEFIV